MKNLKSLLLIAVFTLGVGYVANAQKIGHVNSSRVFANMPETRKAQLEIEKTAKTHSIDIQALQKKGEDLVNKYRAESQQQTDETNKKRSLEVQQIAARVQKLKEAANEAIDEKRNKLIPPIYIKIQKAIDEIAKSKGLLYILDATQGGGLIVANGTDIYGDLKAKLGLLKDLPQNQAKK